jgi:hypothetical protein
MKHVHKKHSLARQGQALPALRLRVNAHLFTQHGREVDPTISENLAMRRSELVAARWRSWAQIVTRTTIASDSNSKPCGSSVPCN